MLQSMIHEMRGESWHRYFMDEQLDVLSYSPITVCLYVPINVMSDYHRYGKVGVGGRMDR